MAELTASMSAGVTEEKKPLGLGKPLIIWPTVEDVRCSLEVISSIFFHMRVVLYNSDDYFGNYVVRNFPWYRMRFC